MRVNLVKERTRNAAKVWAIVVLSFQGLRNLAKQW